MTLMRLAVANPNTNTILGWLPQLQDAAASMPLSDVGALTFTCPFDAKNAALLGQPRDIVTQVLTDAAFPADWFEPVGGRFLYTGDQIDLAQRGTINAVCKSAIYGLSKAIVPASGLDADGRRTFTGVTLGVMLDTLFTEAVGRGAMSGFTWSFTTTVDSQTTAWATTYTRSFDLGKDFLSILTDLAAERLVDFYLDNGRRLNVVQVVNTGYSPAKDGPYYVTAPKPLRVGVDATEVPQTRSWEDLASQAIVQGDNGTSVTRTNGTTPWGDWESFVSGAGHEDTATLNVIGDAALINGSDVKVETTLGLSLNPVGVLPFRDYTLGTKIVLVGGGVPEDVSLFSQSLPAVPFIVTQIALTRDSTGKAGGTVTLGDRFVSIEAVLADSVRGIIRARGLSGGGDGAPAQAPGVGWVTPTFGSGVSNIGGGFRPVGVHRIGRLAELRGVAICATAIAANGIALILPVGYRPLSVEVLSANVNNVQQRCDVLTDGTVRIPAVGVAAGAFIAWSLSFYTD